MRAGQRGDRPIRPRIARAGLLAMLVMLTTAAAGCGPESYDPEPKEWKGGGEEPKQVAQPPPTRDAGESGESGGLSVCSTLTPATVQDAFGLSETPTTDVAGESSVVSGLEVTGSCAYVWPEGSLTVAVATATSEEGAVSFLDSHASSIGLSGESVEGLGDASLLDTSGEVAEGAAVALGASDIDEGVGVVVMLGPTDADPSAYAAAGSPLLDALG